LTPQDSRHYAKGEETMLKYIAGAVAATMALAATSHAGLAADKKYVFALVPKNMNNPFFDQALAGCRKAEKDLGGSVECEYIGPGEHGGGEEQAQIVADLVAKKVDGIAISPANAAAIAHVLPEAKKAGIPVLTWDSDVLDKDKALRIAYIGTHNYDIGTNLAKIVMQIKPHGGTICIQSGGAAAANHNERMQGIRDTLSGQPSKESPGTRLTGQNGWKEVDGCPLYTNDDFPLSVQQMEDVLGKYPNLDAFVPTGGFPQFVPQAYKRVAEKYKAKIADGSLALVVADTLPVQIDLLKAGLSEGQVGQRPFDMGYKTMFFLKDIKDGKAAPSDPTYTGLDVCTPKNAATCVGAK
jgi:ribose transport system substrate-binding protein